MASHTHGMVLRGIERIFNQGSRTGFSEAELLHQFATGDEGAFEALLTRHGPTVLGVCRRILYDHRDVEDAFQATFLVLLRKAGSLRDADALGCWLHGVAYRVAARIRSNSARRKLEEAKGARPEVVKPECALERTELRTLIDEEIRRLPEKYRRPVVLCYLEGKTHDEAAQRLRCSTGSVRGRLDRARQKLKERLIRRGIAPTAAVASLAMGGEASAAAVPAPLITGTIATLARAATAKAVWGAGSSAAIEIAASVFRSMNVARLKFVASLLVAGGMIAAVGAAWLMAKSGSSARHEAGTSATVAPGNKEQSEELQGPDGDQIGPTIELRIVDHRSGKPLSGVTLTVTVDRIPGGQGMTDDAGRARITVPAPLPRFLSVLARKEGYAPVRLWFPIPLREDEIPASYTHALYPKETIAGIVRDEQGRPVSGVRVGITVWTNSNETGYLREEFESLTPGMTDADGRWHCDGMPAGVASSRVSIALEHPDYQHVDLPAGQAIEEVRRGKATVLPRGFDLAGRVIDQDGRPIKGAKILCGSDRYGRELPRVESNADGEFRFSHLPAGETAVTVQAVAYAPELQKVVVGPGSMPMKFRLRKGRTIRGRVVNGRGEPLVGANVNVDGWRGQRTLEWDTKTDDEGEFQWDDAPPDSFWINVVHDGYLRIIQKEVPPDAGDLKFTLTRRLKVRGIVVDAETHHAVKSFTVVPGMERGGWATYWNRRDAHLARKGRYEIEFPDMTRQEGRRLRVEAEGYQPAVSRVLRDDEDDPVINFALKKGAGVSGVVHLPDGSPLPGADVVLVVTSGPAFLENGLPPMGNDQRVVKTVADGRFAFPAEEPPYTIVALHDRGFAEQPIRAAGSAQPLDLKLRPWGRIEGTLRIGRRPGAGQTLSLSYEQQGDSSKAVPWWSGKAKTAESGQFVFERVMPGKVTIAREILLRQSAGSQTIGYSHTVDLDVAAGATARLTMGGKGRPLVGKVTMPAGYAGPIDWSCSQNSLIPELSLVQKAMVFISAKKPRVAWGGCSIKLEPDGSFRTEDVEAGTYDMMIVVREPPRNPNGIGLGEALLATARREVVVPSMPDGRSDEPLDLGTITLTLAQKPAASPAAVQKPVVFPAPRRD